MTKEKLERFIWRFTVTKELMDTEKKKQQYAGTKQMLMSKSKEDLVNSVLALTSIHFQDKSIIEELIEELEKHEVKVKLEGWDKQ